MGKQKKREKTDANSGKKRATHKTPSRILRRFCTRKYSHQHHHTTTKYWFRHIWQWDMCFLSRSMVPNKKDKDSEMELIVLFRTGAFTLAVYTFLIYPTEFYSINLHHSIFGLQFSHQARCPSTSHGTGNEMTIRTFHFS